ncbi:MAG: glycosyltransferase [Nitrospinae bacterium]|nr:glycosyltransferase [Nitrospinota bacterium]
MDSPLVSVILPAHNEEKTLGLALMSLIGDEAAVSMEIIVVDDGSTDKTLEVARGLVERFNNTRVIHLDENLGPSSARNVGASGARGRWLAFLDADSVVDGNWRVELSLAINNYPGRVIIGGRILPLYDKRNRFQRIAAKVVSHKPRFDGSGAVIDLPGGQMIIRKDEFMALGGFNESLRAGEDTEFVGRARKNGLTPVISWNLVMFHRAPETSMELAQRQFAYGKAFTCHLAHSGEDSLRKTINGGKAVMSVWWQLGPVMAIAAGLASVEAGIALFAGFLSGWLAILGPKNGYMRKVIGKLGWYGALVYLLKSWSYQVGSLVGWMETACGTRR